MPDNDPGRSRNRFNLAELGGAFVDLDTLIPFVVGARVHYAARRDWVKT